MEKEIRDLADELQMLCKSVEVKRDEVTEGVSQSIEKLEKLIVQLEKNIVNMQSLPNKFIKKLEDTSPHFAELFEQIAAKRENVLFLNIENRMKQLNTQSETLIENIQKFNKEKSRDFKKSFRLLLITAAISSIVAVASSYATMRFFPHKVNIDNPQRIEINNSDVGLWSSKNVQVKGDVKDYRR